MLARGLTSSMKLLVIKQNGLGILMLLAASNSTFGLTQSGTAHSVEFVNLHLLCLTQMIGLRIILYRYVAHRLTNRLLP